MAAKRPMTAALEPAAGDELRPDGRKADLLHYRSSGRGSAW